MTKIKFNSAMRNAFEAIPINKKTNPTLAATVMTGLQKGFGIIESPAWNAHLSYKTSQQLKAQGVL